MDDRVAVGLDKLAAELRARPLVRDWVDAYNDGEAFGSDVAAFIFGRSTDTVLRRAEAAAAAGQPLGIFIMGTWLFDLHRILNWIEQRKGLPARTITSGIRGIADMAKLGWDVAF
jgi:hypothetical protein